MLEERRSGFQAADPRGGVDAEREIREGREEDRENDRPCCTAPVWMSSTIPRSMREADRQQRDVRPMSEEEAFEYYRKTVIGSLQEVFNTDQKLRERAEACMVYESEIEDRRELRVDGEGDVRRVYRGSEGGYRNPEGGYRIPERGSKVSEGGYQMSDGACRDCERGFKGFGKGYEDFRKGYDDSGKSCGGRCGVPHGNLGKGWDETTGRSPKNGYEPRTTTKHYQEVTRTVFPMVKEGKTGMVPGRCGGRRGAELEETGYNSQWPANSERWHHRVSWRDRSWKPFTKDHCRSFSADEAEEVVGSSSWFNGKRGGGCQARQAAAHHRPRGFYVFVPFDDGGHSEGEDEEWLLEKGPRGWAERHLQSEAGEGRSLGKWETLKRHLTRLVVAKGLERRRGWAEERELMMDILLQEILDLEASSPPIKRRPTSKESPLKWFVESCPCVRATVDQ